MAQPLRHDWNAYEALTAESDAALLRSLTPERRFALYEELFELITQSRSGSGDWARLDAWNWQQKLQVRMRANEAFRKMDESHARRNAANNAG